ncbi:molybdopterin molybdotransferase MoeA [Jannaschia pohangensis]|uniref:Molybdopterin molybdenumtransferase n=1 Tax=Jannaschia pohangensis TaxID=390807 RepID=A0A1I3GL69_9RHOB|nr:molybdopterin molybdotransferase MoeA [Jannaschia pohangensis]SFI24209.1 molybdopterin molybdotransferase [Jannaschia pohangensis]
MITVEQATAHLLDLVDPLSAEDVGLRHAAGRVLAQAVQARHDQPPFDASAMDGYAVSSAKPAPGDIFRVIGESAAGRPFSAPVTEGEAVRIFTGAIAPEGTKTVVIQEDVSRDGDRITLSGNLGSGSNIRPAAGDFAKGEAFAAPRRLGSRDIALLAAMGHGTLPVVRRPTVAILMTGDELRNPGEALDPGQITASNGYGLAAMLEAEGAEVRLLPLARDTVQSLAMALRLAGGADLVITIGGASVGDHDLVAQVAGDAGLDLAFHKVAMRPGKPLLAGRLGEQAFVGLPGNPVSAMVCGVIFILPMLRKMLGLAPDPVTRLMPLGAPLTANGPRQHYMRARVEAGACRAVTSQDSALLSRLASADCLIVRPPNDPSRETGFLQAVIDLPD